MNLKFIYLIVMFFIIFRNSVLFAQYNVVLKNDTLISDNQYDFDIFIKSETNPINLTAYQFILTVNDSITQTAGNLSFNYIDSSSELSNIPKYIDIVNDHGVKNYAIGSDPGSDSVYTKYVKIGSFRISGTNPFGRIKTNVSWDFEGLIKSEININNINRTAPSSYIDSLKNPLYTVTNLISQKVKVNKFELFQNYPNPFNPTTKITYNLPEASMVTLSIYNIIGQKVASIINGNAEAGNYSIIFNGADLPSGTYLYRLQTKNFTETRKMVLLK